MQTGGLFYNILWYVLYTIERNANIFLKKVQFIGHEVPLFSFNARIPLIFEFGNNENTYYHSELRYSDDIRRIKGSISG